MKMLEDMNENINIKYFMNVIYDMEKDINEKNNMYQIYVQFLLGNISL